MKRRQFAILMGAMAGYLALAGSPLILFLKMVWAQTQRRLLPAGTDLGSLIYEDPDQLDPRNLPITPVSKFGTMGLTEHRVHVNRWRLSISGSVTRPMRFSLEQIKALPVIEHDVLLICPGAFAYYARWRGVSLNAVLEQAGASLQTTHVDVSGPSGELTRTERFPMDQIRTDKVFLAYSVNNKPLPEKHGFPLRLVAEDRVGSQWIKFVDKIDAVVQKSIPQGSRKEVKPGEPAFIP
jgi:DMSO/TMAO reductase YedYZ molybdopterin-dependent catalytic subunit